MKIRVGRRGLLTALTHGNNVVEKHTTVPILSHTLLKAEGEGLTLSSTDLELSLVAQITAEVIETGSVALPTNMLFELIRKFPESAEIDICWDAGGAQAEIKSGKISFKIPCLSAEDFPHISKDVLPVQFKMPASVLLSLLERTKFAMSTEETRYYLNGVFLHVHDGTEMRAVATDGNRLAKSFIGAPEGAENMPGVIISRKTVNELVKLLAAALDDIAVSFSETQALFVIGDVFLSSRLIDGTFPDYDQVIPKMNEAVMRVEVKEFSQAIDRVATMASDKDRGVRLILSDDKLILEAASNEYGSGVEELGVDYQGPELKIGFNARYLLDVMTQLPKDEVFFALKDAATAVLIHGEKDPSSVFVIMPMRV